MRVNVLFVEQIAQPSTFLNADVNLLGDIKGAQLGELIQCIAEACPLVKMVREQSSLLLPDDLWIGIVFLAQPVQQLLCFLRILLATASILLGVR